MQRPAISLKQIKAHRTNSKDEHTHDHADIHANIKGREMTCLCCYVY